MRGVKLKMTNKFMKPLSVLLTVCLLTLSGCSFTKSETSDEETGILSNAIGTEDGVDFFDVGEGQLYTSCRFDSGRKYVIPAENENESDIEIPIYETRLSAFDFNGNKIKECVFGQSVSLNNFVTADDGNTFYYNIESPTAPGKQNLMKYTFGEKQDESLCILSNLTQIKRMALVDNNLFVLGISNREFDSGSQDYIDSGETLISIDLDTLEQTTVMPCGIIDFAPEENSRILIYAHDNDGFYLTKYSLVDMLFSDKEYKKTHMISGLSYAGNSKYCFTDINGTFVGEYGKDETVSLGYENAVFFGKCVVYDGSYFSLQGNEIKITDISSIISQSLDKKVRVISAEEFAEKPNANGISVSHEIVGRDSFALTVLSQDSNYDICLAYSREDFAASLRDKGSFYPLNEIDGVSEYLDSCFPYLKEAATDSDGNIWMLPVASGISALMVNEPLCEELGAKDIMTMDAGDFINFVVQLGNDAEKSKYIGGVYYAYYGELLLSGYLAENDSFDTDEFRELAKMIKTNVYGNLDMFENNSENLQQAYMTGDYSNVAFDLVQNLDEHKLCSNAKASVRPVPMFTNSQPSIATITFVSVNPYSDNLSEAKRYISILAKQLQEDTDSIMLQDSPLFERSEYFSQLKSVCYNAKARFSLNYEIFLSDYDSYMAGDISLEDFIAEADRKLKAYLYE